MDALLYTVPEASRLLGISRSKTYELIANGELASVRIGTCRRIPRQSIIDYISRIATRITLPD